MEAGKKGAGKEFVLVADGYEDAATSLCEVLTIAGVPSLCATSAAEALALFQEHLPRVVVADIQFSDMSTTEFVSAIRRFEQERTWLIALTAWIGRQHSETAQRAGYDYFFTKPPATDELVECVMRCQQSAPRKPLPIR
jgi:CheY-like chemotaxis protein